MESTEPLICVCVCGGAASGNLTLSFYTWSEDAASGK